MLSEAEVLLNTGRYLIGRGWVLMVRKFILFLKMLPFLITKFLQCLVGVKWSWHSS